MSWLIWRELAGATRTAAWWLGVVAQTLLLSAFIVVWGDGVPIWNAPFFGQFTAVHLVFLGCVMPWVGARVVHDGADRVALLALLTVERPVRLVIARAFALTLALVVYALTALPMTLTAMRISALTPGSAVDGLLTAMALGGFVAATLTALTALTAAGRVAGWLLASAATLGVLAVAPSGGRRLLVLLVAAAAMMGVAAMRANRRLRYVGDSWPSTVNR